MIVASDLSTGTTDDLVHLCNTSSRLLHIVRPFLFRKVKVKATGDQSNATHVLALLAQDKSLAKRISELTFERCPPPGENPFQDNDPQTRPSLINVEALANMVSLKRVALYGAVFRNAHEQHEFGRVLAPGSGIPFDELTYVANQSLSSNVCSSSSISCTAGRVPTAGPIPHCGISMASNMSSISPGPIARRRSVVFKQSMRA
jgi:hypothetical protein